ncbi:LLM class flavin-dependent oxidoreductase [Chelatococcus reniformis]|nr:LLM class flavin-dependent oxidoreductase [Chelatococcus reniformis]
MRHGIFLPPFHAVEENPAAALDRDFALMEFLDKLGFEEAWIGEHHSAGYETIASPELFIATAAERTKHIRFGTGVISLPYHNPLMVANRIIQLDHQTRGRIMFGAGPGLLASDAIMLDIDPRVQRDRMEQSLDVILRLFKGEVITEKTDWYSLKEARAHLLPFTEPYPEVVVASAVTPSGGRLAGRYDLGMLCVAAAEGPGFKVLRSNWEAACEIAAEHGRTMDPQRLRLVAPIHIAETREQARKDVRWGLQKYVDYVNNNMPRLHVPPGKDVVDWWIETNMGVAGTPDDAIALIEKLKAQQGDFGVMLTMVSNIVDFEPLKKSFELYRRYVVPHFNRSNQARRDSYAWVTRNTQTFSELRSEAAKLMVEKHERERSVARAAKGTASKGDGEAPAPRASDGKGGHLIS